MIQRPETDAGTSPAPLSPFHARPGSAPRLTPQETLLLSLLIQGHHKKTAADAMGISVNTVSFHLKNIYAKLDVHSKTEAVVRALLGGIVAPPGHGADPRRAQEAVPETARCSQARENVHSRSTVARETPRVVAISSIVRPPKNLSSTI